MKWAIGNKRLRKSKGFYHFENNKIFYYSENERFFKEYEKGLRIAIDGFVLPRYDGFDHNKHLEQRELIYTLYKKNGVDFIRYLKGVFTIILISNGKVHVYNDRHSIKKFFIYRNENTYMISNNLAVISKNGNLTVSKQNAAIFTLMEHFIDGLTLFDEVVYSRPATWLSINPALKVESYWSPDNLINMEVMDIDLDDFALRWKTIIEQYIDYLKPKGITMTLTGGNDTRMVLAALLNIGIKPHTFTFGNPESADGMIARKIADSVKLKHHNYFNENPTSEWFKSKADEIVCLGNSLINIHRAHRLDASEKEIKNNPEVDMILSGFMGGDYIKGIVYDDYITARLVRLWEFNKSDRKTIIKDELEKKYINHFETEIDDLVLFFEKQKFFSAERKIERQFQYIYNVIGAAHDVQDTNVFGMEIKHTVNPFMDIDFLEMLFSSKYSMLFKRNDSKNQFKRLFQPMLHCKVTDLLFSELSDIEFSKKSAYTPAEFLGNKLVYVLKRFYRFCKPGEFPINFPYGEWIRKYCIEETEDLHPVIKSMCHVNQMKKILFNSPHYSTEGHWHQFTNIINLNKIVNYYKNG